MVEFRILRGGSRAISRIKTLDLRRAGRAISRIKTLDLRRADFALFKELL